MLGIEKEAPLKITTHLPNEIHSITYVKNSHWIELEDHDGVKHKMHDNGMVRYECSDPDCGFACLTFTSHGEILCPLCSGPLVPVWHRMQVCFVPEKESAFAMPQTRKDGIEKE